MTPWIHTWHTAQYIYTKHIYINLHSTDKSLPSCETKLEVHTSMPCSTPYASGTGNLWYWNMEQTTAMWSVLLQWLWAGRGFCKHLKGWPLYNTWDNNRSRTIAFPLLLAFWLSPKSRRRNQISGKVAQRLPVTGNWGRSSEGRAPCSLPADWICTLWAGNHWESPKKSIAQHSSSFPK